MQGAAHGRAADADLPGDALLGKLLARPIGAVHDLLADMEIRPLLRGGRRVLDLLTNECEWSYQEPSVC